MDWTLPMVSLIHDDSFFRLKTIFETNFEKLTEFEVQALVAADLEGSVDNASMRQITNQHPSDITKILQHLAKEGYLLQEGQGRGTLYKLPSVNKTITPYNGDSLLHNEGSLLHNQGSFLNNTEDRFKLGESQDERWHQLEARASKARLNKRLTPNELEMIILEICKEDWLTRQQISNLLNRNSNGIGEKRLLELRYPDILTHKFQAYRAVIKPTSKLGASISNTHIGHSS